MEQAKEIRVNRPKTFDELKKDIDKANDVIKKNPPPQSQKKPEIKSDIKGGVRGDIFDKSSFKKSF